MHSYPTRKRMKNTRFLSNSYTHILPQFLPNLQRDLPGNHAYGVCHSAFSEEGGHKGRLLRRMLNDAESEQALHLLEFRAVLMTYALCLCPHIFSFFTHTSCSFLDLETNERCEVTNTLLQLTYQFVCLFHRQLT